MFSTIYPISKSINEMLRKTICNNLFLFGNADSKTSGLNKCDYLLLQSIANECERYVNILGQYKHLQQKNP